jgi:alpha-1,6-mannosyltransferase
VGSVVFATFAAAPGSPFQPVLPSGVRPNGPFTALATAIGLDRLAGTWLIVTGVMASALAVAGFLVLVRESWRGRVSLRTVIVLVIVLHAVVLTLPLLFSRDVYSYAFYGRIAAVYDANPYVQTPVDFGGDALWPLVGPKWVDTPAVYGPLFTTVSSGIARSVDAPAGQVDAYRWLAAIASLATVAMIAGVARRLHPERAAFAAAVFGVNPVVVFHAVGSGHNDLLVALAVVSAFALLVSARELPAVAVLALGALVKATAVLPLALVLVWCIARRPPGRRARTAATHGGLAIAIGVIFSLPYLQTDDPTLGMLRLAGHEGWLAPSVFMRKVFDMLSFGTMGWLARVAFAVTLILVFLQLARDVGRRAADGESVEAVGAAMGWSMVLLMLLGPVLLPWYVVWALPLAWLLPKAPRATLVAAGAALALAQWSTEPLRYPDAFAVNLWIGHWIVTPAMFALVLWCLLDLRRRFRDRLPLGEADRVPASRGQG